MTEMDVSFLGVLDDARARQRRRRIRITAAVAIGLMAGTVGVLIGGGAPTTRIGSPASPGAAPRVRLVSARCSKPSPTGASQASPSHAFLSILGALRRPSTAADQLPAGIAANVMLREEIFIRYVRRAEAAFGRTYYLVPEISRMPPNCQLVEGVDLLAVGSLDSASGGGATAGDIESDQFDLSIGGGVPPTTFPTIVPDGVASVTVHYPPGKAGGFDRHHLPAATITAFAVNNVIVLRVPRGGNQAHGAGTVTWRAKDGRVIKTLAGL